MNHNEKGFVNHSLDHYKFTKNYDLKKQTVVFHTLATQNFLKWYPLYSKSISSQYGDNSQKFIQTVNAKKKDMQLIHHFDSKTEIYNTNISKDEIASKLNLSSDVLNKYMFEQENGKTTNQNFHYKLFISVQLRYLSIKNMMIEAKNYLDYQYFIHSDIDINHRSNILEKIQHKNFDIALFGRRPNNYKIKALGAYIIFKNNERTMNFLDNWYSKINALPFSEWPRGFGQISLNQALSEAISESKIILCDLSEEENITFSKLSDHESDIWLNSNSDHPGSSLDTPFTDTVTDIAKTLYLQSAFFDKRND